VLALDDCRAIVGRRIPQVYPTITAAAEGFQRDLPLCLYKIADQLLEVVT
jgi:hypothetical protein